MAMPLPANVVLDVTNACNLRCRHCSYHGERATDKPPRLLMPERVWRAVVEEIGTWDHAVTLHPWCTGEPLLHPQFWDVIALARQQPNLSISFYSNGTLWTDADVQRAFDLEVDWITISVDGVRKDVFEHYRVGSKFEKVIDTVHRLRRERDRRGARRPSLRVNMVQYPELADHAEEFVAHWQGTVDEV